MINKLLALTLTESQLAAVGPSFYDPRSQQPSGRFNREVSAACEMNPVSAAHALPDYIVEDYLITSGCLIPLRAWRQIGPLKESFFIDYVDVEWGLRAKALGLRSLKAKKVKMAHYLGDRITKRLGFSFVIHSPQRTYFQVRNRVWLYCFSKHSFVWKMRDALRLILRLGFNLVAVQERRLRMKMAWRGLVDGVIGRLGPDRRK